MTDRKKAESLLNRYIKNENLRHHCHMVAEAMEAYARDLDKPEPVTDLWWATGLLHDLDWEKYPEQHPAVAVKTILPEEGYPIELIEAIEAHAPERTGREPESELARYLFACDELSGFMHAVSLVRPNGFTDMKVKSVKKKLKDKSFAENVPRSDIKKGTELIDTELEEHIQFLINCFRDY